MSGQERREFVRVPLPFPVTASCGDKTFRSEEGVDVSARGVALHTELELAEGAPCTVWIHLSPAIEIEARCVVRRRIDRLLATEIVSIDLEAFELLRELIRHNSEEPDLVAEQFCSHLGLAEA